LNATLEDDPRTDDAITADFRVFQRVRGHRYSIDDVLTAWVAATRAPAAGRILDLGSGIGSVAIMLAWKLRDARLVTVEVQDVSLSLQHENLARNDLDARVLAVRGDFREASTREALAAQGPYELVTGTPPYFPAEASVLSTDAQRAYARVELRGGVEAYLETAAPLLTPGGLCVVCADAKRPHRVLGTAGALGLVPEACLEVHPREGKPALFSVWALRRAPREPSSASSWAPERWVARTADGARTPVQREIRRFFGLDVEDAVASPPSRPRVARGGVA
jgi:tRNA1(Val) A37 N6-methylase TrmN6